MSEPYPKEFRDDVVRVARSGEHGVPITDVAADFGVSESCLGGWLTRAERDDALKRGPGSAELAELAELKKRNRLLEQENRGAAPRRRVPVPGEPANKR